MATNSPKSFKLNTYYKFDALTKSFEVDSLTLIQQNNLRQITLFCDDKESTQQNNLCSLIGSFSEAVILIKNKKEHKIIWQAYIHAQKLNNFVNNKIRESQFDYIIWPKNHHKVPKLIVFDMDSTFIQIEVIDELARVHNVGEEVSKVTESAMRGELDFSESLITRVACLKDLNSKTIEQIANKLPLSFGVNKLVEWAHLNDIKIAIVSGGFTPFVEKLKEKMGLYRVKANNLEIANNKLTGKVLGKIVDAQSKADFINLLKKELNLESNEIMAIGDGANDLVMMQETGFSLAYKAKPAVDEKAKGRMKSTNLDHLISVFTNQIE